MKTNPTWFSLLQRIPKIEKHKCSKLSVRDSKGCLKIHCKKKILIPVAEEQKILWLFKRNHWVTLQYDPQDNQATLLDSRPWFVSFLYPTKAMNNELKKGIESLYGSEKANTMVFYNEYQSVQYNDTHCGSWTCRNILDLSRNKGRPLSIIEQKNRYSAKDEESIILDNMELVGYPMRNRKTKFSLIEKLLFWLGVKVKPRSTNMPSLERRVAPVLSPALGEFYRENKPNYQESDKTTDVKKSEEKQTDPNCDDFEDIVEQSTDFILR